MCNEYGAVVDFIKSLYPSENIVPLHAPRFFGNEKKYLADCIDSAYVSYIGKYVTRFEDMVKDFTGSNYAIATVNGTEALHVALKLVGVSFQDEVITQALTFVAAANAIHYCGAKHVFIDVEKSRMGMSSERLEEFLENNTVLKEDGKCYNKDSNRRISACVPMHTFGHPVKIDEIKAICDRFKIPVVEDAAESLGSFYKGRHTGTFGRLGILSFNGNKTITTGGGGMIITNDEKIAGQAKHLTTTAKVPHKWEYIHDKVGYNYRMPNVNAAIGCAQMEKLSDLLKKKRELAATYRDFFNNHKIDFFTEPENSQSNYWLNTIIMEDKTERDFFLEYANHNGVMCRPAWRLMNHLRIFQGCQTDNLENSNWLEQRIVNIPSSARL